MRYNKLMAAMIATGLCAGTAHAFDMDLGETVERDEEKWAELTEISSEVEVGLGYVDEMDGNAYRFGHFTGLDDSGAYLILDADLRHRDPHDSDRARHWSLRARNLGLRSRQLETEYGEQGRYRIFFDYTEIPTRKADDTLTPFRETGGNLRLPEEGSQATIEEHLRPVEIGLDRQQAELGGEVHLSSSWSLRSSFSQTTREGTGTIGLGSHWAVGESIIAPLPVDETTKRYDIAAAWRGEDSHLAFGYRTVQFNNEYDVLRWDNAHDVDWAGEGEEKARAPDNEHHEVYASGNHRLGEQTHLSASASVGRSLQDARFVGVAAMSRDSLDAAVDTSSLGLQITGRPTAKLRLTSGYQMDRRDNDTGQVVRDNTLVIDPSYNYTRHRFDLGGNYRLASATRLNLDYRYTDTERDPAHSESSEENSVRARLRTGIGPRLSGGLSLGQENRRGSTYTRETGPDELRNYAWADRDRTRGGVFAQYFPTEILSLSLTSDLLRDRYDESDLGLTEADRHITSLDSYLAISALSSLHGFVSYEESDSTQAGETWVGDRREQVLAVGVGGKTQRMNEQLELGGDFSWVESLAELDVDSDGRLPDVTTRVKRIDLYAGYQVNRELGLRLRYRFEDYDSDDWSTTGNIVTAGGNIITLGQDDTEYQAQSIGLSLAYRF
ncbi:MtrB/PioB family decaheme-associated outer membrane protein [Thiohalomonas denitrificans]|uniref:MtrB/PioB family decaheme-associated outer membrane protein n=1 Tax=Thiohalomonas denitrificans TaxID=415747 RepID=UPI0026ED3911|nr:MtrB/PioB family decaheme-associated outer membrane protein [Thiohalomonas denitrificans]